MKSRSSKAGKIIAGGLLACAAFVGALYLDHDIGVRRSKLEEDIRMSQKIKEDWAVEGAASDTVAAYISYPPDRSDHTFSVYVNRSGLSLGYFFRAGGSLSGVDEGIAAYTIEGYGERAFISMNKQGAERLEIGDGNSVEKIEIDGSKPFAIVLPANVGTITFYDGDENEIPFWEHPL